MGDRNLEPGKEDGMGPMDYRIIDLQIVAGAKVMDEMTQGTRGSR